MSFDRVLVASKCGLKRNQMHSYAQSQSRLNRRLMYEQQYIYINTIKMYELSTLWA